MHHVPGIGTAGMVHAAHTSTDAINWLSLCQPDMHRGEVPLDELSFRGELKV